MNWVLIVSFFLYGAGSSNPNIMTVVNIPGFQTEELCQSAAQKTIDGLFRTNIRRDESYQRVNHVCLRQQ